MKLTKGPINKIVAVYPGRFQPMGKHHKATYDWMVANFGADNSFIITSDKVCLPDSPFCFDEKARIANAYGIPEQAFKNERIVYAPTRYQFLQDEDPDTTAVIVIVGEKDLKDSYDPKTGQVEKARFQKGVSIDAYKRDGTPKYFKTYTPDTVLQGFGTHGYIMQAPHQKVDVGGREMSGSALRRFLPQASEEEFKDVMGFEDPEVRDIIKTRLNESKTLLEHFIYSDTSVDKLVKEMHNYAFFKHL